jgi:hypothetical protein
MHWSDFFRSDAKAYMSNPSHAFVYNRMDLLCEQGVQACPLVIPPERYPVSVDHVIGLDEDDTHMLVQDDVEFDQFVRDNGSSGKFWVTASQAELFIVDMIVNNGIVRCHDAFLLRRSVAGLPLFYRHQPGYCMPGPVVDLLARVFNNYTGPVSLRIQEDVATDCRLRWNSLNYVWKQQIDFVKIAPARVTSTKTLRPLIKALDYIPCWIDEEHTHADAEMREMKKHSEQFQMYSTKREERDYCHGYVRIGVFVVNPEDAPQIMQLKKQHGWT